MVKSADWAMTLTFFPVDRVLVACRWYIPAEAPVIPAGWIYRLAGGEILSEYRLKCCQQSRQSIRNGTSQILSQLATDNRNYF